MGPLLAGLAASNLLQAGAQATSVYLTVPEKPFFVLAADCASINTPCISSLAPASAPSDSTGIGHGIPHEVLFEIKWSVRRSAVSELSLRLCLCARRHSSSSGSSCCCHQRRLFWQIGPIAIVGRQGAKTVVLAVVAPHSLCAYRRRFAHGYCDHAQPNEAADHSIERMRPHTQEKPAQAQR